jgi:hypothetical protein
MASSSSTAISVPQPITGMTSSMDVRESRLEAMRRECSNELEIGRAILGDDEQEGDVFY